LGHTSDAITADIYAFVPPEQQQEGVEIMGNLFLIERLRESVLKMVLWHGGEPTWSSLSDAYLVSEAGNSSP
jgi:hypothetical protein